MPSKDADPVVSMLFAADTEGSEAPPFDVVLLPGRAAPTVVVPRRPRRAAAAVLGAHSGGTSWVRRARRVALVSAASIGAADFVGRRKSLTGDHRSSLFDALAALAGEPVVIGVHLGPPRANRKPVLQVLSERGRTLAFVKVGVDDLTRRLLANEADALNRIAEARLRSVVAPQVLGRQMWREHELLMLSPIRTAALRRPSPAMLRTAMQEISAVGGNSRKALIDTTCWQQAAATLEALGTAAARALSDIVSKLDVAGRDVVVQVGGWHGDWAPWNVSAGRQGRLVVWDWERFGADTPLGFDALHFDVQRNLRRTEPRSALRSTIAELDRLLAPLGVPVAARRWVLAAYLVVIGTRYLQDDQAAAGSRVGDLDSWLVPELAATSGSLLGQRSAGERR